jgi:hypothetical protein
MTDLQSLVAVTRAFEVQGRFRSANPYGSGHIHDTYCVTFDLDEREERILLQRMNTGIFKNPAALVENIERVTSHLRSRIAGRADAERRVLRLIAARDGNLWHVDAQGGYWRAYWFIEGANTYDAVSSAGQAFEAARAFGGFQRQLADLPPPRLYESLPGFHDTARRFEVFERAVGADVAGRRDMASGAIAFATSRRDLAYALAGAGLPERVTHNDTKLNNVLIDDATGEGLCVIDLDTVMPGLAAYDFGDMVRTMTCPAAEDEQQLSRVAMDFDLFDPVLRGYLEGAGSFLTAPERASLIAGAKVIIFEQGIRFLTDYLAGDTYYKVSRPDQNLDRSRTQFTLLESIERQEDEMTRLVRALA